MPIIKIKRDKFLEYLKANSKKPITDLFLNADTVTIGCLYFYQEKIPAYLVENQDKIPAYRIYTCNHNKIDYIFTKNSDSVEHGIKEHDYIKIDMKG